MTNVITIVMTIFMVLLAHSAYALTTNQTEMINNLSANLNMSNQTLIDFFAYLETDRTNTSEFINYNNLTIWTAQIEYKIAIVNSSVNQEIINLIATFSSRASSEAVTSINRSIDSYDSTVNERLSYIKNNYMAKNELDITLSNITSQLVANDEQLVKIVEEKSNFNLILTLIVAIAAGVGIYYTKGNRFNVSEKDDRIPSPGMHRYSIEELTNKEYQSGVRNFYNLIVKINKLKLNTVVHKKAMERAHEGSMTLENMDEIITGIKVELNDQEQPDTNKNFTRRKRPADKGHTDTKPKRNQ